MENNQYQKSPLNLSIKNESKYNDENFVSNIQFNTHLKCNKTYQHSLEVQSQQVAKLLAAQLISLQKQIIQLNGTTAIRTPQRPQQLVQIQQAQQTLQQSQRNVNTANSEGTKQKIRALCTCPFCLAGGRYDSITGKRQHICHIPGCGKVYSKSTNLNVHLIWHRGERPFVCSWNSCGKKFVRKDYLIRHNLVHFGEKKFQCPKCTKKFVRKDYATKHAKIHANKLRKTVSGMI